MAGSGTKPLRDAIASMLPERPFTLEFWDGERVPATRDGGPTLRFRSADAIAQLVRAPGQLGLGRAYVLGALDVDDLDAVIALSGRWKPPPFGLAGRARLLAAAVRAAGLRRPPPPPAAELRPRGARHSRQRDAAAVRHHYDVSNEFFALFLDETLTYSCALFEGAQTLEEAQRAKLELICRKLELRPGQRLLDIGCGWGSLAIHAAREHDARVLGITLSEPQAALARERATAAGLGDRVEIRVMDYRELEDASFDAVASIGMVEHVGESRIDDYARQVARVLAPDGKALNHGITRVPPVDRGTHIGGEFSNRYVFPDGEILNLSRMLLAFERAGLETLHVENLHSDYAETLRHWSERLDQNLEEAERLAGPERVRVWRLYLRAARNSFETAQNAVCQMLCSRPLREPPAPRPTARRHEPARRRVPRPRVPA